MTAKLAGALFPQTFSAVTVIFPPCPVEPVVTVIEFVPAPAVIFLTYAVVVKNFLAEETVRA